MIRLHQAFYGHQINGYGLLSSSNPQYNEVIKFLCTSIGTPDRVSTLNPIYINYIHNTERYMVKCSMEQPDNEGRQALFFHVIIGNHQDLNENNIGIGTLIFNNIFKAKVCEGVLDLKFESDYKKIDEVETNIKWNNSKLAIIDNNPNINLIAGILKNEIDNKSWASFSFRPLDNYDIYILSNYSMMPKDRICLNSDGTTMNKPSVNNTQRTIALKKQKLYNEKPIINKLLLILLIISMFLNLYLMLKSSGEKISKKDRKRIQSEYIVEMNKKFRENSPNNVIIDGLWSEQMHRSRTLHRQYEILNNQLLKNAGYYIDFMNREILIKGNIENSNGITIK